MKKNNKYIWFLLIIIFLTLLSRPTVSVNEPFFNRKKIILMGDSMLKNNQYVKPKQSVEYLLKQKHSNTLIVAKDNSHIANLPEQFNKIKSSIDKHTEIIISIGGNDILYYNQNKHINKYYYNRIDRLFTLFEKTIKKLFKDTKATVYFLNIYYPKSNSYKKYHNLISEWNQKLKMFTKKHKYHLIEVDKLFRHATDFTNDIEPSYQGSKLLVHKILNL